MLAGTFYYIILFAGSHVHVKAAESDDGNITMRVAIFYDDTLTPDVVLTSESGFDLGYTNSARDFTYITNTTLKSVNVARHTNLKFNGSRYIKASSSSDTTVGCYHIRVASSEKTYEADQIILKEAFKNYNVFPACLDDKFYVMIGQFSTVSAAESAQSEIIKLISPTIIIPEPAPKPTTPPNTSVEDTTVTDTTESDTTVNDSSSDVTVPSQTTDTGAVEPVDYDAKRPVKTQTNKEETEPADSTDEDVTSSDQADVTDSSDIDTTVTTTEEDTTEPDASEDDSTESDTSDDITTEPDSSEDNTTEPETSEEETTEPEMSEEETTEPEPIIIPPEVLLPEIFVDALKNAVIHTPDPFGMVLVDPATHNIVWTFNRKDGTRLFAIGPTQKDGATCYMTALHGTKIRYYDGYFECAGYCPTGYYGIRVVNLVKLENYVVGVASAEIPTWWPIETIKAFVIAARSFAIRTLYGHGGSYNADVCNTSCCQVFNGYGPAVERVWRAATETRGILAVPEGVWNSANVSDDFKKVYIGYVCGTYYSSSTGGCTANCTDVWGSSLDTYPYLRAVSTPWEKYMTYSRGQKISTVTSTALFQRLESQGYTALNGDVTKITITSTGNNTTYVTGIRFYDSYGNVVTVNRADKIKKLLSPYVDSANFVVAKSGESVTRTNYTMLGFGGVNDEPTIGVDLLGNPFRFTVKGRGLFDVLTKNGIKQFSDSIAEKVMTATGVKDFNMAYALDSQYFPTITGIYGDQIPDIKNINTIIETETLKTDYASNSFTFISRGWGHGVGLSQYGIYELGNLGYDYEYILEAYYTGIVMKSMGSVTKESDNRYYINFRKD